MSTVKKIRVRLKIPCTIRLSRPECKEIQGTAEELDRDSAIVLVCSTPASAWLEFQGEVMILVALPVSGNFHPRSLEIAAVVTDTGVEGELLRVSVAVRRMMFVDRNDCRGGNLTKTN